MNSSSKRLVSCGITHKESTLEEREPLQIGHDELAAANVRFGAMPEVQESVVISTCNRIEFCFVTARNQDPFELVARFYRDFRGIEIEPSKEHFKVRVSTHAAKHVFEVAAGIDSMVVGETQIFGQLKEAYGSACAVKTAGKVIHRLFHQAFRVGKQVRTDTEMGKGACSVSSAAIEMLKTRVEEDSRPVVLFIGVNQMIKLAATRTRRIHHSHYMFANRTETKAAEFAKRFESRGYGLDRLPELLTEADVVISCTSSPEPIIDTALLNEAAEQREGRKLVVLDLAIPRDVVFESDSDLIKVLDLEDIKDFVRTQRARREDAIPAAEEIVRQKVEEFNYWWRHVKEEPLYNGSADRIDSIIEDELAKVLTECPPELKEKLNLAARRIAERSMGAGGQTFGK